MSTPIATAIKARHASTDASAVTYDLKAPAHGPGPSLVAHRDRGERIHESGSSYTAGPHIAPAGDPPAGDQAAPDLIAEIVAARSTIRLDIDTHTEFSPDSRMQLTTFAARAKVVGLGAVCVTDHNTVEGAIRLRERGGTVDDLSLAVPAVLGVMLAYLVGGYVAGRMAGYSTSWHGLMKAFFGLFVILAVILAGVAIDRGYLGDVRLALPAGLPAIGEAITFGALLGFLGAIFAGWLGGLLAPTRTVAVAPVDRMPPVTAVDDTTAAVDQTTVVHDHEPVARRRFRLLPAARRKADERVED